MRPSIRQRPYRVPLGKAKRLEQEIARLESLGVIKKSRSSWASTVCLVEKKDGCPPMCLDLPKVNSRVVKDSYPLLSIAQIFDSMQGATMFRVVDLQPGFHQLKINEADIHKLAFITHFGLWEMVRVPFGLCNSPAYFHRTMNHALHQLISKICFVFVDDIIIYSRAEEHTQVVRAVLDRLRKAGLRVNEAKCQFHLSQVRLLGYIVSAAGISADPDK